MESGGFHRKDRRWHFNSERAGIFHNLKDGQIIAVNGSNLQASYTGGDGNDLTLTVVP